MFPRKYFPNSGDFKRENADANASSGLRPRGDCLIQPAFAPQILDRSSLHMGIKPARTSEDFPLPDGPL